MSSTEVAPPEKRAKAGEEAEQAKAQATAVEASNLDPPIARFLLERLKATQRQQSFLKIVLQLGQIGERLGKLRTAFRQFDSDNDGVISKEELAKALMSLGAKEDDLEQISSVFARADVDASGGLKLGEFIVSLSLAYLFNLVPVRSNGSVIMAAITDEDQAGIRTAIATGADMFLLFDQDGSGTITVDEVVAVLTKIGQTELPKNNKSFKGKNPLTSMYIQRFKELDVNADGSISFVEFLRAFISWTDVEEEGEDEEAAGGDVEAAAAASGNGGAGK